MIIAVLSGKGGTGKTFVSVNLAAVAPKATYIDCDVEEPNAHLFLKPQNTQNTDISVLLPHFSKENCIACRKCVDFCNFNALALIGKKVMLFDEICHSCGGCSLVCPSKAVTEEKHKIGIIQYGKHKNIDLFSGFLDVGKTTGIPIIKELLTETIKDDSTVNIIDCPPGSACSVMESIGDADYCVIVTEPTIFGLHNMKMVYELCKKLSKKIGIVLNKTTDGFNPCEDFCQKKKITILEKISYSAELADINSKAHIAVEEKSTYKKVFKGLLEKIEEEVSHEANPHS